MALSNRDRVGRMFDVPSPALDAFITRVVGPELPADTDWSMLGSRASIRIDLEQRVGRRWAEGSRLRG